MVDGWIRACIARAPLTRAPPHRTYPAPPTRSPGDFSGVEHTLALPQEPTRACQPDAMQGSEAAESSSSDDEEGEGGSASDDDMMADSTAAAGTSGGAQGVPLHAHYTSVPATPVVDEDGFQVVNTKQRRGRQVQPPQLQQPMLQQPMLQQQQQH